MTTTVHSKAKATAATASPSRKTRSVNQVILVGQLVAEPAVYTTVAGPLAKFRIVTDDTKTAQFHDVIMWTQDAKHLVRSFSKGAVIAVEGRLVTRTWTRTQTDGQTGRTTQIVARSITSPAVEGGN